MTIDESFFIERQGKKFVLYAGLLQEAHERGLKEITATLVQTPTQANENTAICTARVVMESGQVFEEVGDASPANVSRNIAPHILRMAATRAKARALRDAINVAVTSLEEMGGEDETSGNGHRAAPQRSQEHERLLEEIAAKYEELPEERKPDKDKLFGYAFSKIGNARFALEDLNKRLEASLAKHGEGEKEQ
jgi:hypothetical protein